jgi:hypothetical protein
LVISNPKAQTGTRGAVSAEQSKLEGLFPRAFGKGLI